MTFSQFARKYWQGFVTLGMFAFWSLGYMGINKNVSLDHAYRIALQFDSRIPFIPEFSFVYLGLFPMFLIPFLMIKDDEFFRLFTSAYLTILIACYATFIFFPVIIDRPSFQIVDFSTWVLDIIYRSDRPINCFPSAHVAMIFMVALTVWEINRLQGLLALAYAAAIAASTVFTKQHYLLDVVAGLVLTLAIYYAYFRQRIIRILGLHWKSWELDMDRYFTGWFDDRLSNFIDKRIDKRIEKRVEELVRKAMDKK